MSQADIYNEIENNIAAGQALGLPFDPTEYLSGEHSGLFLNPQQPVDNPNFGAALTQAGIMHIGSDASREPRQPQVGGAITVPRHPTALYYNTSTQAAAVDEYNWLYTTRANGGSGYCEDNPATATCIAPLDTATGFTSYIVPTDAAFDLELHPQQRSAPVLRTRRQPDRRSPAVPTGQHDPQHVSGRIHTGHTVAEPHPDAGRRRACPPDEVGDDRHQHGHRIRAERSDHRDEPGCRGRPDHRSDRHHDRRRDARVVRRRGQRMAQLRHHHRHPDPVGPDGHR